MLITVVYINWSGKKIHSHVHQHPGSKSGHQQPPPIDRIHHLPSTAPYHLFISSQSALTIFYLAILLDLDKFLSTSPLAFPYWVKRVKRVKRVKMPIYPPTTESTPSPTSGVTASLVPAISVPTYGTDGTLSVLAKTRISATPSAVLEVIRNTNDWKEWNTFCPHCVISPEKDKILSTSQTDPSLPVGNPGWLEVGSVAKIDVFMSGDGLVEGRKKSRDQEIVVTRVEKLSDGRNGFRIAWKSTGWSHWQLHSERVMDFVEVEEGVTEYICWETFGGILSRAVKAAVGATLVDRFGDYARDVKAFLEKREDGSNSAGPEESDLHV